MPVAVTLPDCRGGPLEIVDKPELVPRPGGLKDTLLVQRPPLPLAHPCSRLAVEVPTKRKAGAEG